MPKAKTPARLEAKLLLGGFSWKPTKRKENGDASAFASLSMPVVHAEQPCAPLAKFLEAVRGLVWVRFECGDLAEWVGLASMGKASWEPSIGVGDDVHPTVSFSLTFEENDKTRLLELVKLRLQMDDLKQTAADVVIQVWQEDLPFEE